MPKNIMISVVLTNVEPVRQILEALKVALPHIEVDLQIMESNGILDQNCYDAYKNLIERFKEIENAQ